MRDSGIPSKGNCLLVSIVYLNWEHSYIVDYMRGSNSWTCFKNIERLNEDKEKGLSFIFKVNLIELLGGQTLAKSLNLIKVNCIARNLDVQYRQELLVYHGTLT
ncbi:hypothetical protein PHYBLDRAFT_72251 [Phycomyces blakesleeanus NRRL 1555(-)]|uniref:Uncharacterized protein n=1 Tax=Phycomyces blakesleeanus (strain ATCC 8743b / DSM 1359 / FGSC 10004 / NBRC 33097 / NRRL 1555) TaxID=763407 RepID=A0A167MPC1_PHYB8|nr:hypothetical protein PHYBLDRAFT_72251 [Phycomyces blakesleeanus NRRL 1555(-)]OAD73439.1 hypothetical protein PHYBLDRAFT_72251 [Phycomyces blakesleeanus NRRL 1555(-)]|eukprot:XP_018291479.1 hypothetical protein PHYBLDRAFT_72251 [Phycomyces blakesleeanus NRRL 1555(-)]